jgi:hypothetical protein
MCDLYESASREQLQLHFGVRVPTSYGAADVLPFGEALCIRATDAGLAASSARWGLLAIDTAGQPISARIILGHTMASEAVGTCATTGPAWRWGQRCLVAAAWYDEPGSHPRWSAGDRRRLGLQVPWALAGIWTDLPDPTTGRTCLCCSLLTVARRQGAWHQGPCSGGDRRGEVRSVRASAVPIAPIDWVDWLEGSECSARRLLNPDTCKLPGESGARWSTASATHTVDDAPAPVPRPLQGTGRGYAASSIRI